MGDMGSRVVGVACPAPLFCLGTAVLIVVLVGVTVGDGRASMTGVEVGASADGSGDGGGSSGVGGTGVDDASASGPVGTDSGSLDAGPPDAVKVGCGVAVAV